MHNAMAVSPACNTSILCDEMPIDVFITTVAPKYIWYSQCKAKSLEVENEVTIIFRADLVSVSMFQNFTLKYCRRAGRSINKTI